MTLRETAVAGRRKCGGFFAALRMTIQKGNDSSKRRRCVEGRVGGEEEFVDEAADGGVGGGVGVGGEAEPVDGHRDLTGGEGEAGGDGVELEAVGVDGASVGEDVAIEGESFGGFGCGELDVAGAVEEIAVT